MRLISLHYKHEENDDIVSPTNNWNIESLRFDRNTFFVGKNTSGKSRGLAVIWNLSRLLEKTVSMLDGKWDLEFISKDKIRLSYELEIKNKKVLKEVIKKGEERKVLLERTTEKTEIFSNTESKLVSIRPPEDQLVLNVRRDQDEHPFLEEIADWAKSVFYYKFTLVQPHEIAFHLNDQKFQTLSVATSLLEKMGEGSLRRVCSDIGKVGFPIESIEIKEVKELKPSIPLSYFKEEKIKFPISQFEMSTGFIRAYSILVILEYHLAQELPFFTLMIDDIGEGMDYSRSKRLIEVILGRQKESNYKFNLILTSNYEDAINSIDLQEWTLNVLIRDGVSVHSINKWNHPEIFEQFEMTGLNNFDLFASNFISSHLEKK